MRTHNQRSFALRWGTIARRREWLLAISVHMVTWLLFKLQCSRLLENMMLRRVLMWFLVHAPSQWGNTFQAQKHMRCVKRVFDT